MCQKIHMFPVIFIKTEIAAIGAVSQRRIRLPREAHFRFGLLKSALAADNDVDIARELPDRLAQRSFRAFVE